MILYLSGCTKFEWPMQYLGSIQVILGLFLSGSGCSEDFQTVRKVERGFFLPWWVNHPHTILLIQDPHLFCSCSRFRAKWQI